MRTASPGRSNDGPLVRRLRDVVLSDMVASLRLSVRPPCPRVGSGRCANRAMESGDSEAVSNSLLLRRDGAAVRILVGLAHGFDVGDQLRVLGVARELLCGVVDVE